MDEEPPTPPNLAYATLWARFAGTVIDIVFLVMLLVPVIVLPDSLAGPYIGLWLVFLLFYTFILEGVWTNQTVGKYAMKMKVAKDDGSPAGIVRSIMRNTIGLIGQASGWLGLLVGAFAIYQSETNKRLGDNVAGTVVIETGSGGDAGD